ncbi:MAG: caspase family protein, partial [Planctomycetota bacterium]|nr:caspase family protein [Planctomycetota bacterium]
MIRGMATAVLLACVWAAPAPGRERSGSGGRTYALLIGLNYTNDSEMAGSRLRYSANDVEAIREMLLAYWGAAAADIDVLTDDENPDARLVKRRIAALANRAGPGDRIVLFYSGHGATDAEGRWGLVPYRPNRE